MNSRQLRESAERARRDGFHTMAAMYDSEAALVAQNEAAESWAKATHKWLRTVPKREMSHAA